MNWKSIFALILLFASIFSVFSGCAEKEYKFAWDGFCYTAGENSYPVELAPKDQKYILRIMNNSLWSSTFPEYEWDFIFSTQRQRVYYHCTSGTFADITSLKSLTVSEEERTAINNILKGHLPK